MHACVPSGSGTRSTNRVAGSQCLLPEARRQGRQPLRGYPIASATAEPAAHDRARCREASRGENTCAPSNEVFFALLTAYGVYASAGCSVDASAGYTPHDGSTGREFSHHPQLGRGSECWVALSGYVVVCCASLSRTSPVQTGSRAKKLCGRLRAHLATACRQISCWLHNMRWLASLCRGRGENPRKNRPTLTTFLQAVVRFSSLATFAIPCDGVVASNLIS